MDALHNKEERIGQINFDGLWNAQSAREEQLLVALGKLERGGHLASPKGLQLRRDLAEVYDWTAFSFPQEREKLQSYRNALVLVSQIERDLKSAPRAQNEALLETLYFKSRIVDKLGDETQAAQLLKEALSYASFCDPLLKRSAAADIIPDLYKRMVDNKYNFPRRAEQAVRSLHETTRVYFGGTSPELMMFQAEIRLSEMLQQKNPSFFIEGEFVRSQDGVQARALSRLALRDVNHNASAHRAGNTAAWVDNTLIEVLMSTNERQCISAISKMILAIHPAQISWNPLYEASLERAAVLADFRTALVERDRSNLHVNSVGNLTDPFRQFGVAQLIRERRGRVGNEIIPFTEFFSASMQHNQDGHLHDALRLTQERINTVIDGAQVG